MIRSGRKCFAVVRLSLVLPIRTDRQLPSLRVVPALYLPGVLSGTKLQAFSSNSGSRETGLLRRECLHVSYIEDRHAQMCRAFAAFKNTFRILGF